MLLGTHFPKLDDKARLIMPAKYRDQLSAGLVMTRGQDRCLYVYPMREFEILHEKMKQAPVTSKRARDYIRVFLSGAVDQIPDKQGRISVPQMLRDYAHLDRDVTVIGQGDRLEIWDSPTWESVLAETEEEFSNISEEVIPGIF